MGQNLSQVKHDAGRTAADSDMKGSQSNLEFCQVVAVDVERYLVTAYLFTSRMEMEEIPFGFAYQNLDKGIVVMPEIGSIGVVGWLARNEPVILTFVSLPGYKSEGGQLRKTSVNDDKLGLFSLERLLPGEILLKGSGRGYLKLNSLGDAKLSTSRFHYIELEQQRGLLRINVESQITDTELSSEYRGVARYFPDGITETLSLKSPGQYYTTGVRRIFDISDNTVENFSSASELARALLDSSNTGITQQVLPVMEVTEGNIINSVTGTPETMTDGSEICYQAKVLQDNVPVLTIKMSKSGKMSLDTRADIVINTTQNISLSSTGDISLVSTNATLNGRAIRTW